ncbi:hypothetical protein MUGA111182_02290 [Mucilaginibacter galii]|uniref:hypothetical protein n=1 Tax=Mucilaginibacter galii TaxID=2005073 RepID=UPI001664BC28|nr:hypothetical protein [Mucilaginibacter galii]
MADIDVKPKNRTPGWLWILLLIIAVALLYFFLRGTGQNTGKQDSDANSSTSVLKKNNIYGQTAVSFNAVSKVRTPILN